MRVAAKIEICKHWRDQPEDPPCLVLKDDEGDTMAAIPLPEIAEALAPYLIQVLAKRVTTDG